MIDCATVSQYGVMMKEKCLLLDERAIYLRIFSVVVCSLLAPSLHGKVKRIPSPTMSPVHHPQLVEDVIGWT